MLKFLGNHGIRTQVAENGVQAIEALKQHTNSEPFTLVLMDCQMHELDGYQTTEAIRSGEAGQSNISLPIIAMTANAMQGDKQKCLNHWFSRGVFLVIIPVLNIVIILIRLQK